MNENTTFLHAVKGRNKTLYISLTRWLASEEDVGSLFTAEFPGRGTIDARDMAITRSTFVSLLTHSCDE